MSTPPDEMDALRQAQMAKEQLAQRFPSSVPEHQDINTSLETSYEAAVNGFNLSMKARFSAAKAFVESAIAELLEKEECDKVYLKKAQTASEAVKLPEMTYAHYRQTNQIDVLEVSIERATATKSYLPKELALSLVERIDEDRHETALLEILPIVQELARKLVKCGAMQQRLPEFKPELVAPPQRRLRRAPRDDEP